MHRQRWQHAALSAVARAQWSLAARAALLPEPQTARRRTSLRPANRQVARERLGRGWRLRTGPAWLCLAPGAPCYSRFPCVTRHLQDTSGTSVAVRFVQQAPCASGGWGYATLEALVFFAFASRSNYFPQPEVQCVGIVDLRAEQPEAGEERNREHALQ